MQNEFLKKGSTASVLIMGSIFFLAADSGIISPAGGLFIAIIFSLLNSTAAIYFLIMIASVQDARGLEESLWYPSFAIIGMILLVRQLSLFRLHTTRRNPNKLISSSYLTLAVAALAVVLYSFAVSMLNTLMHGLQQSEERPPIFLAGLMVFMIVTGVTCTMAANMDGRVRRNIGVIALLSVVNGLLVSTLQAAFGPTLFASHEGASSIMSAAQLTVQTALGFPRLVGTYLTPNGFALCMALLMLIYFGTYDSGRRGLSRAAVWFYLATGLILSVFTLSKSVLILFLLSSLIIIVMRYGWLKTGGLITAAMLVGAAIVFWHFGANLDALTSALRIPNANTLNDTYRVEAWRVVFQGFTPEDWIFGTGLAHWPVLFQEHVGFELADPHMWILSIPGTFGLPGVIFYCLLGLLLCLSVWNNVGGLRFVALALLLLIFVVDMFEISYVLNNAPLSFLIWLCLGLILSRPNMRRLLPNQDVQMQQHAPNF